MQPGMSTAVVSQYSCAKTLALASVEQVLTSGLGLGGQGGGGDQHLPEGAQPQADAVVVPD